MIPGSYRLKDAKRLLKDGRVQIDGNATQSAWDDFGWTEEDIKEAFKNLKGERLLNGGHFYKTGESEMIPGMKLDFYKAENLKGERVYLHFYIEDEWLVINSFKKLD